MRGQWCLTTVQYKRVLTSTVQYTLSSSPMHGDGSARRFSNATTNKRAEETGLEFVGPWPPSGRISSRSETRSREGYGGRHVVDGAKYGHTAGCTGVGSQPPRRQYRGMHHPPRTRVRWNRGPESRQPEGFRRRTQANVTQCQPFDKPSLLIIGLKTIAWGMSGQCSKLQS